MEDVAAFFVVEIFALHFEVSWFLEWLALTAQPEGSGFDSSLGLDWGSSWSVTTGIDSSSPSDLDWE